MNVGEGERERINIPIFNRRKKKFTSEKIFYIDYIVGK